MKGTKAVMTRKWDVEEGGCLKASRVGRKLGNF